MPLELLVEGMLLSMLEDTKGKTRKKTKRVELKKDMMSMMTTDMNIRCKMMFSART